MRGLSLHAKYCFMPNRLGGCGVQGKSRDLLEYGAQQKEDRGLEEMLKTFEAAYPYLQFIARENNISDPFSEKVVEAYWIGNDLLERVDKKSFYNWCHERYGKKVSKKALAALVGKVPEGALPHHSFHVFNSYFRTNDYAKLLNFVNKCRIGSGVVTELGEVNVKLKTRPIELGLRGLSLGQEVEFEVTRKLHDRSFVSGLVAGDVVTYHWGWACDKITPAQQKKLEHYTESQLKLFNNL